MARRYEPEMWQTLVVAREAELRGDVPVGTVVLGPGGSLIGANGSERELADDPAVHAEVVAIRRAAEVLGRWRLTGCTLVVALEPCTICAGTVVTAQIDRLVFGAFDNKAGAVTSLFGVLRDPRFNHHPKMASGVLEADCAALLEEFFERRQ